MVDDTLTARETEVCEPTGTLYVAPVEQSDLINSSRSRDTNTLLFFWGEFYEGGFAGIKDNIAC